MFVCEINKDGVVKYLMTYAESLGKKVTRNVGEFIASLYKMIKEQTKDEARYIECTEEELAKLVPEYINPLTYHDHILLVVYLGQQVSYNCKSKVEQALFEASKTIVFPSKYEDDKIRICLMFYKAGFVDTRSIDDSAIDLLYYF